MSHHVFKVVSSSGDVGEPQFNNAVKRAVDDPVDTTQQGHGGKAVTPRPPSSRSASSRASGSDGKARRPLTGKIIKVNLFMSGGGVLNVEPRGARAVPNVWNNQNNAQSRFA